MSVNVLPLLSHRPAAAATETVVDDGLGVPSPQVVAAAEHVCTSSCVPAHCACSLALVPLATNSPSSLKTEAVGCLLACEYVDLAWQQMLSIGRELPVPVASLRA